MDGSRIRKLRKEKHLTQTQLANLLNVDQTLIGKWELHGVEPSASTLAKMANIFECSTDYLITGKESDWHRDLNVFYTEDIDDFAVEILRILKELNVKNKNKLLTLAYELEDTLTEIAN